MVPTTLQDAYRRVRDMTEALCEPLAIEDYVVQVMPDASPAKWHLAHTTWFFETFLLAGATDHRSPHPLYAELFNSYYNGVGAQWRRGRRGVLSRPTVAEIMDWRARVDAAMLELIEGLRSREQPDVTGRVVLGLHHEQQHQELLVTDLKAMFAANPLSPVYRAADPPAAPELPLRWVEMAGGLETIGFEGPGFHFDNEGPRHEVVLRPFRLASRPVTCGEFDAFVEDGGYERPDLWLSDGWDTARRLGWTARLRGGVAVLRPPGLVHRRAVAGDGALGVTTRSGADDTRAAGNPLRDRRAR